VIRMVERTSRKHRTCDGCGGAIRCGDRYRVATATPGEDYADPDRWSRLSLHADGYCWGGTGPRIDLALEAEWQDYKQREAARA
jgi:hypothetical protein